MLLQIDAAIHLDIRIVPGLRTKVNVFLCQLEIVGPLRTNFAALLDERLERLGLFLKEVVNLLVDGSPLVVKRL